MGTPSATRRSGSGEVWSYDYSTITFDAQGRVTEWSDISNNLRVTMGVKAPGAPAVRRGSTTQEVVAAMGTPSATRRSGSGEVWSYDYSTITFDAQGRVAEWSDISNNLRVTMGVKTPGAPAVRRGSTTQEVVAAMGTPSATRRSGSSEVWSYDYSTITFDTQGHVVEWSDISNNLRVTMGE